MKTRRSPTEKPKKSFKKFSKNYAFSKHDFLKMQEFLNSRKLKNHF
ncbi:hypothetical protein AQPE_4885 [Aquipluma nitroreducens]|uniref:Uncharacterized protein n=1 Tax=Aquipluma nitroreducens TaxID=2010828 RepID=A0A5K7SGS0_9BACT|nr:hypothetical protein AQPE_4855 [Aquipluma nitroreducens]BBE20669.1 hypothetical protein AQPE_4863 [Aquipluma nitroreducens]BBE20691.1 hypothetical protein AQPE_4885 [Aquipluma nitroreducens]